MADSATPRSAAPQASLSFIISQNLLKFMSTESVILFNHQFDYNLFTFLAYCLSPQSQSQPQEGRDLGLVFGFGGSFVLFVLFTACCVMNNP